jgi:hypothetical protein
LAKTSSEALAAAVLVALALMAGGAGAAEPTAAEIASARALFQEADAALAAGDPAGAREKLTAAFAIVPTPIIGIGLARVQEKLGQLVEARETCFTIARTPVLKGESGASSEARADASSLAAALEGRIAKVKIALEGAAPDREVTVEIDGAAVPRAALGAARQANPGAHTIVVRAGGAEPVTVRVTLAEGESKTVPVTVPPAAATATATTTGAPAGTGAPIQQPPPGRWWARPLLYTGIGVAGAGAIAGAITGALAISAADRVKAACQTKVCAPGLAGDIEASTLMGNVSTVAFAFAGAGVIAAIIGGVAARPSAAPAPPAAGLTVTPVIGPGSVGVTGRF